MNAPWMTSRRAASNVARDIFSAFVCDDQAVEMLKPIVNDLSWQSDKVFKGGVRNAIQTLSVSASPQILLIDFSESSDPIQDINSLAEVCEPGTVVVALGKINDVGLYRDLLASGIHDYLLKPAQPELVREALMNAHAALFTPKPTVDDDVKPKSLITIIGVRGGVGSSTLATSIAWLQANEAGRKTALLDLDIQFGTGALSFDLEPGRGLTDALENPNRIDSLFVERAMVKESDNLSIMSAEAPINMPLVADPSAFHHLQEELRNGFEAVVVDLPRHTAVQTPQLLNDSNYVIVVTELNLASTRDTIRLLAFLKNAAHNAQILVVGNRVPASGTPEVSRKDFEASIERKVDFLLPVDLKVVSAAATQGKSLAQASKGSKIGAVIREISALTGGAVSTNPKAGADATAKSSMKDKFSNFTSKLKKK
jgi:pilus assembly protein CpaE